MSDSVNVTGAAQLTDSGILREVYEPPTLTPIGNVRDLLAGATGSFADAPVFPDDPRQQNP